MVTLFVFFWNTYGWKSVEMRVKLFKNWKHVFKLLYQTGPKSLEKCKPSNVWSLLVVPKAIWLTKNILFLTKYFTTKQTLLNVKKKKFIKRERGENWKEGKEIIVGQRRWIYKKWGKESFLDFRSIIVIFYVLMVFWSFCRL